MWYQGHQGRRICKWALCNLGLQELDHYTADAPMWWPFGLRQRNLQSSPAWNTRGRRGTCVCVRYRLTCSMSLYLRPWGCVTFLIWREMKRRHDTNDTFRALRCRRLPSLRGISVCCLSCRAGWRKIHPTAPPPSQWIFLPKGHQAERALHHPSKVPLSLSKVSLSHGFLFIFLPLPSLLSFLPLPTTHYVLSPLSLT